MVPFPELYYMIPVNTANGQQKQSMNKCQNKKSSNMRSIAYMKNSTIIYNYLQCSTIIYILDTVLKIPPELYIMIYP
jgi:hypothetical protein